MNGENELKEILNEETMLKEILWKGHSAMIIEVEKENGVYFEYLIKPRFYKDGFFIIARERTLNSLILELDGLGTDMCDAVIEHDKVFNGEGLESFDELPKRIKTLLARHGINSKDDLYEYRRKFGVDGFMKIRGMGEWTTTMLERFMGCSLKGGES